MFEVSTHEVHSYSVQYGGLHKIRYSKSYPSVFLADRIFAVWQQATFVCQYPEETRQPVKARQEGVAVPCGLVGIERLLLEMCWCFEWSLMEFSIIQPTKESVSIDSPGVHVAHAPPMTSYQLLLIEQVRVGPTVRQGVSNPLCVFFSHIFFLGSHSWFHIRL